MTDDTLKNSSSADDSSLEKETDTSSDDIVFEDEDSTPKDALKKLREQLRVCEYERMENLAGWQRARADFVNQKKEFESDRGRMVKFAEERLIHELLSVLDSFDIAFGNLEAWEKVDINWRLGVEHIHAKFLSVLLESGVTQIIPASGEKYNPGLHVPLSIVSTDDKEKDDTVADVVQKGYSLYEKVIRPAQVNVFHLKE